MEKQVLDVLRSKRFWAMLVGLAVMLAVAAFPQFASAEDQLISSITFIVLLLIGGYSLQDVAIAWLSQPGNITVAVDAAQAAVDYGENFLKIDIPDSMEAAAKEELRKVLQRVVDNVVVPPVATEVTFNVDATNVAS